MLCVPTVPAKKVNLLDSMNGISSTVLNNVFGPCTIAMLYSNFALGGCQAPDDACAANVGRIEAAITAGFIFFYPFWQTILKPISYMGVKFFMERALECYSDAKVEYAYKIHKKLISEFSYIVFYSAYYFMFTMFAVAVSGYHHISDAAAIFIGIGCFLFAILLNKELQNKFISRYFSAEQVNKKLLIWRNLLLDMIFGFTIVYGVILSIENSLYVIGKISFLQVYHRLAAAAGGAALYTAITNAANFKNIICKPAILDENDAGFNNTNEDSVNIKIAKLILKSVFFCLFATEIMTSFIAIQHDKAFEYFLIAISAAVLLIYPIGRQWIFKNFENYLAGVVPAHEIQEDKEFCQRLGTIENITESNILIKKQSANAWCRFFDCCGRATNIEEPNIYSSINVLKK